jgi:hypothetical protein
MGSLYRLKLGDDLCFFARIAVWMVGFCYNTSVSLSRSIMLQIKYLDF